MGKYVQYRGRFILFEPNDDLNIRIYIDIGHKILYKYRRAGYRSKKYRKQYRKEEKQNKTTHKQQIFALMVRFLVFYPVKMYFQMLSHPVTLANKGVNTISY